MAVIYLCPADRRLLCSWEGRASEIKHHFEEQHAELLLHQNGVDIDLSIDSENKLMCLQNEIYLVQSFVVDRKKVQLKLRFLGTHVEAAKRHYDVSVNNIDNASVELSQSLSSINRTPSGWEIDLEILEEHFGSFQTIQCALFVHPTLADVPDGIEEENRTETSSPITPKFLPSPGLRRSSSDVPLHLGSRNIEICDETEEKILDSLSFLDGKLKMLRQGNPKNEDDLMDNISQLNLSILESPFKSRKISAEDYHHHHNQRDSRDSFFDALPDISEELNLACTTCDSDMLPPIYVCSNGHNICISCRTVLCKRCNAYVTDIRNAELENVSRTHKHSCKYFAEGCTERLLYNEVREHEIRCRFCKYRCLYNSCIFEGRFENFTNHLKIVHGSVKTTYSLSNEFPKNKEFFIVNKSRGIFFCKSELEDGVVSWRATFCGPKERLFFCELYFKGGKLKEPVFLKRNENIYEIKKSLVELKKLKLKEKYAVLNITSYDN